MKRNRHDLRIQVLYAFSFLLLLFSIFYNIGVLQLAGEEPRRAVVSMEMILGNEYISPHINAQPYYNKPPLFNWVMAGFMTLFNSYDEWVVRLPSLLSLILSGLLNFLLFRKFTSTKIALTSSLMFITSADIIFYGSIYSGEMDLFFSMLTYLQIMLMLIFYMEGKYLLMFVVSYVLAALGFLTKGMPSIAFQVLTIFGIFLVDKNWKKLFSIEHLLGILSFTLPVFLHFYFYSKENDLSSLLIRILTESLHKSVVEVSLVKHFGSFLSYPLLVIKLILPWSIIFLALASKASFKLIKENRLLYYMSIFIVFNLPVYWFSNKQAARYIYMFFPFMINILCYVYFLLADQKAKIILIIDYIFLSIFILCIAAVGISSFLPGIPFEIRLYEVLLTMLSMSVALIFYIRENQNKLIYVILLVAMVKFLENKYFLPFRAEEKYDQSYRSKADTLLSHSGGNPIFLTGDPFIIESLNFVYPVKFKSNPLQTAPLLPYEIPYYLMKKKNYIMEYHSEPIKGLYYISTHGIPENRDAIYRFWDDWQGRELILYRH